MIVFIGNVIIFDSAGLNRYLGCSLCTTHWVIDSKGLRASGIHLAQWLRCRSRKVLHWLSCVFSGSAAAAMNNWSVYLSRIEDSKHRVRVNCLNRCLEIRGDVGCDPQYTHVQLGRRRTPDRQKSFRKWWSEAVGWRNIYEYRYECLRMS